MEKECWMERSVRPQCEGETQEKHRKMGGSGSHLKKSTVRPGPSADEKGQPPVDSPNLEVVTEEEKEKNNKEEVAQIVAERWGQQGGGEGHEQR